MGFRHYINKMPKKIYNKIKSNKTIQEMQSYLPPQAFLINEDDVLDLHIYYMGKQLYELGKYVEFPKEMKKFNFFKNKEIREKITQDYDLFIIDKEGFKHIILMYKNFTEEYYKKLLNLLDNPPTDLYEIEEAKEILHQNIRSKVSELKYGHSYCIDDSESITKSWEYEYSIFQLIYIYKTFNWKKDVMYITGW